MPIYKFDNISPSIDSSVYVAPDATIIGDVIIGKNSSIWFNCVIRGDDNSIRIGEETNIQDLTMLHSDPRQVLSIGNRVTIGHRCIIHGCTIEDECLIGMGAIVMTGAIISRGTVVAAGAVVTEDQFIPPFSRVTGIPGTVSHTYEKEIIEKLHSPARIYVNRATEYKNPSSFKEIR